MLKLLAKSQASSLLATLVDYGALIILVEFFEVYYVVAVAIGAALGAVTNFTANRIWTFHSHGQLNSEIYRYALVSMGSLVWNTFLVWLLTEEASIAYYFSKIIVSIAIGLVWNYPLHRYWVFKYESSAKKNNRNSRT